MRGLVRSSELEEHPGHNGKDIFALVHSGFGWLLLPLLMLQSRLTELPEPVDVLKCSSAVLTITNFDLVL